MQTHLNRKVKYRESFRPYAPVVIAEEADKYFSLEGKSPVMLRVVPVLVNCLPAITHIDRTARVQTVMRSENSLLYDLLLCFKAITGIPVLLNTSFNISGQPIVESPEDALRAFTSSGIDLLVIGKFVVTR
jgi:carbamoyltransferase